MSQNSRIALVYNQTGQTVEIYPPEKELRDLGFPTSAATYSVWRGEQSNDDTAVLSGTATLDSVSTTLTASAGYAETNRRQVSLASAVNVDVAIAYGIANSSEQREIVRPYAVTSSSGVVKLENELQYDYVSGASFVGLRHSFTIDSTFIQDSSNINVYGTRTDSFDPNRAVRLGMAPPFRVRWTYTAGSIQQITWTYFDVVRQRAKHNVTIEDLRELDPDISDRQWKQGRGSQYQKQLDGAWDRILFYVRAAGYDEDRIREGPMLDELVRCCTLMIIAQAGNCPPKRELEQYITEKTDLFYAMKGDAFGAGLSMWIDTGSTGAIDPQPYVQPRWIR